MNENVIELTCRGVRNASEVLDRLNQERCKKLTYEQVQSLVDVTLFNAFERLGAYAQVLEEQVQINTQRLDKFLGYRLGLSLEELEQMNESRRTLCSAKRELEYVQRHIDQAHATKDKLVAYGNMQGERT